MREGQGNDGAVVGLGGGGGLLLVSLAGAGELAGSDLAGLLALVGIALPDIEADLEGVVAVEIVRLLLRIELHVHARRVVLRAGGGGAGGR